MNLEEALRRSAHLVIVCTAPACGAHTRVDVRFFINRRGLKTDLADLARTLSCTACGGDRVVAGVAASEG